MKRTLTILLILFWSLSNSQNLVTNPSFEDTLYCPYALDLWALDNWLIFNQSPDYYHYCDISEIPNVDNYPLAATGNAYIGIFTFAKNIPNYREYLGVKLLSPLEIGVRYYVSFKIMPWQGGYCNYTNNIGALFCMDHIIDTIGPSSYIGHYMHNYSQVFSSDVIGSGSTWVSLNGSFIADSAYRYIILGNFFTDSATIVLPDSEIISAYYFIDDVCVSEDSSCFNYLDEVSIIRQSNLSIYPNPMVNKSTITFFNQKNESFTLEVFDNKGNKIRSINNIRSNSFELNRENLKNGLYILKLYSLSTKPIIKKILII